MDGNDELGVVGFSTLSASLYRNLESYPGQLMVTPPLLSANQETKIARRDAVRAARQVERNNEHVRGAIAKRTDMVVGSRLTVQPMPDWDILPMFSKAERKEFINQCSAQFNNWAYDSRLYQDAEGHYDFGGLMWLAYRGVRGPSAECAGVIQYDEDRMIDKGLNWATYVALVNPERIQTPAMMAGREEELNIFEGKQLDKDGRWIGLYILRKHPSEGGTGWNDYAYAPRENSVGRPMAFHYFEKTEPGAQRGMTSLLTILKAATHLEKRDDADLGAAVLNAMFAVYAKSAADADTVREMLTPMEGPLSATPFDQKIDFYKKAKLRIGENRLAVLPPGDELVMEAINRAAQDPTAFVNLHLRKLASATGTSFEQLSQNFSDANYSAARAALLEVWRGVLSDRTRFAVVPSMTYGAVIEEAIERRRIKLPAGAPSFAAARAAYTRCGWTGPGMGWIDPLKEAQAMKVRLETRTTNRQKECANNGDEYYPIFEQYGTEIEEARVLGFELDPPMPGQAGAMDPAGAPNDDRSGNQRRAKPTPAPAPADEE
jgi:lambda family phage portal protein